MWVNLDWTVADLELVIALVKFNADQQKEWELEKKLPLKKDIYTIDINDLYT